MNAIRPVVLARYGAYALSLVLGAAVAALSIEGARFSVLVSQAFGVSVFVLLAAWLAGVLLTFSRTGDIPEEPAALAERIRALEADRLRLDAKLTAMAMRDREPEPPPPPAPQT